MMLTSTYRGTFLKIKTSISLDNQRVKEILEEKTKITYEDTRHLKINLSVKPFTKVSLKK